MSYTPPLMQMQKALRLFANSQHLSEFPKYEAVSEDLILQILTEAGKLAQDELAPLNAVGDRTPACLTETGVRTSPGFQKAYQTYYEAGWNSIAFDPEYGGQGLPQSLTLAVNELWQTANLSFGLCPMLNNGAVEALQAHASPRLKEAFLPNMISGAWTGTMNLTESQAGSDLASVQTKAEPVMFGTTQDHLGARYHIQGQKIFITYGDHDLTENIIHLVLARLPGAPKGVKGISLFVVPKFLILADGSLGAKNDVACLSLEHKLGIHASPTCVMAFGVKQGAVGYLVGEAHKGLAYMFTMMNNARLGVALQGVAIGERAYQQALSYAQERVQGRVLGQQAPEGASIIYHADVRRMLVSMRGHIESGRGICYFTAGQIDMANAHPEQQQRQLARQRVDILIPIAKAFVTDIGVDVSSTAIQIVGGMGYIEETGLAQYYRDARIAPIYEGTNGIQALDLLGRKMLRDEGEAMRGLIVYLEQACAKFELQGLDKVRHILTQGFDEIRKTMTALLRQAKTDEAAFWAGAVPFLRMWGHVLSLWVLAKMSADQQEEEPDVIHIYRQLAMSYALLETQPAYALGKALRENVGQSVMSITPQHLDRSI